MGKVQMIPGGNDMSDEMAVVNENIQTNTDGIAAEVTRAQTAESTNAKAISDEIARAKKAEAAINTQLDGVADALAAI